MTRAELLASLPGTVDQLAGRFRTSSNNVRNRLWRCQRAGEVWRDGSGTRNDPYRYHRADAKAEVPPEPPHPTSAPTSRRDVRLSDPLERRIILRMRDLLGREVTLTMLRRYVRARSATELVAACESLMERGVLLPGDGLSWRYW